jgi:hypothetical protein
MSEQPKTAFLEAKMRQYHEAASDLMRELGPERAAQHMQDVHSYIQNLPGNAYNSVVNAPQNVATLGKKYSDAASGLLSGSSRSYGQPEQYGEDAFSRQYAGNQTIPAAPSAGAGQAGAGRPEPMSNAAASAPPLTSSNGRLRPQTSRPPGVIEWGHNSIPPDAVDALRRDRSPGFRRQFDQQHGDGASAFALGELEF